MNDAKSLAKKLAKKYNLGTYKTLEIENRLMEERLKQLKLDIESEKEKRNNQGGVIWNKGQSGPLTSYGKQVLQNHKANVDPNIINKATKLKILKDEPIAVPPANAHRDIREKTTKCGQCEKKLAFVHCVECSEDYCINCFSTFHSKGALKKHKSVPLNNKGRIKTPIIDILKSPSLSYDENQMQDSSRKSSGITAPSEEEMLQRYNNYNNYRMLSGSMMSQSSQNNDQDYDDEDEDTETEIGDSKVFNTGGQLLNGDFDEREAHESFKKAVLEWRTGVKQEETPKPQSQQPKLQQQQQKSVKFKSQEVEVKKGVDCGTENIAGTNGLPTKTPADVLQDIEDKISSNSTMSYAERLLLKKYRRSDVEDFFNVDTKEIFKVYDDSLNHNKLEKSSVEMTNEVDYKKKSQAKSSNIKSVNSSIENFDAPSVQHIDFNQLMRVLQVKTNAQEPAQQNNDQVQNDHFMEPQNLRIEEVSSSLLTSNERKMKKSSKERPDIQLHTSKMQPEITIETKPKTKTPKPDEKSQVRKSASKQVKNENIPPKPVEQVKPTLQEKVQTKQSVREEITKNTPTMPNNTPRLNSARQKSARPKSVILQQFESHITQKPNNELQSIANRQIQSTAIIIPEKNDLTDFFLLSVKEQKTNEKNKFDNESQSEKRPSSSSIQKLSYKLYEMAPRSWVQNNSVSNTDESMHTTTAASIENFNKNYNHNELLKNSESEFSRVNSNLSSLTTVSKDYDAVSQYSKKTDMNVNQQKNQIKKNVVVEQPVAKNKIEFKLSEGVRWEKHSAANSIEHKPKTPNNKMKKTVKNSLAMSTESRKSTASRCKTPSNPLNIDLAGQYLDFDEDDGRSSRFVQNEEDNLYFEQLGNEFSVKIKGDKSNNKASTQDTNYDTNVYSKKQFTASDINEYLKSETAYDYDDDLSELDFQELRNLK